MENTIKEKYEAEIESFYEYLLQNIKFYTELVNKLTLDKDETFLKLAKDKLQGYKDTMKTLKTLCKIHNEEEDEEKK